MSNHPSIVNLLASRLFASLHRKQSAPPDTDMDENVLCLITPLSIDMHAEDVRWRCLSAPSPSRPNVPEPNPVDDRRVKRIHPINMNSWVMDKVRRFDSCKVANPACTNAESHCSQSTCTEFWIQPPSPIVKAMGTGQGN